MSRKARNPRRIIGIGLLVVLLGVGALVIPRVVHGVKIAKIQAGIRQNRNAGHFADNIALYTNWIERDGSSEAYLGRAGTYLDMGEYDRAIVDVNHAIDADTRCIGSAGAFLLTMEARLTPEEYAAASDGLSDAAKRAFGML